MYNNMKLTQEEKTIKLAEVRGYTSCGKQYYGGQETWRIGNGPALLPESLPDYFNDLNAVHELFECIPQNLKPKYFTILCSQVSSLITLNGYYEATEATAEQRCEAIGKTLNLW